MKQIETYYSRESRKLLPSVDVSLISLDVHPDNAQDFEAEQDTGDSAKFYIERLTRTLDNAFPEFNISLSLEGRSGKHLCLDGDFWLDGETVETVSFDNDEDEPDTAKRRQFFKLLVLFGEETEKLYDEYCTYWSSPSPTA